MPPDHPLPQASLEAAVQSLLGVPSGVIRLSGIQDISPGIGTSRIFRLLLDPLTAPNLPHSLILKVPDWGAHAFLNPRDPWLPHRERAFFQSSLPAHLPPGLRTPPVLRIEERDGRTWLWMEDLAECFDHAWSIPDAIDAARRSALLAAVYRQEETALRAADWLERDGYAAYAHHIPRAHENLDQVSSHPRWSNLFSPEEITRLRRCLDLSVDALTELRQFPPSLVHGDFHIRNLGYDPHGNLVCIDWAHVGLAPLGSDIAVLVSLFHAFGGAAPPNALDLDRQVLAAYAHEVERLTGESGLLPAIGRTFALWQFTWGLHLRLGPGLSHLLAAGQRTNREMNASAADIREGCQRALVYADSLPT